ncbi:MAG: hypothetical protein O3A00_24975 [Planctomycetota bacterium]|nr:hypothetical protein [Planctomycetota bacterium]
MSLACSVRCVCAPLVLLAVGCNHFVESKVIEQFTLALQDRNLSEMKLTASTTFSRKALRRAESLDDLKIVGLPNQPPTIVRVEDISENEKHVTVTAGKTSRKLLYKLVRKPKSKDWVVDDVYMKRKTSQRVEVTRTVSDQMDLLLSVRDFMDAWESADREQVLGACTPTLQTELSALPPSVLAEMTLRVMGADSHRAKSTPDAQLEGKVALVKLPRLSGDVLVRFQLTERGWKVDDVAVESRRDDAHIASLRKTAVVLATASRFLTAVSTNDRGALSALATKKFYAATLDHTDLAALNVSTMEYGADFNVTVHPTHATVVVPAAKDFVQLRLVPSDPNASNNFLVEDLRFFAKDGAAQKSLSAMTTAKAKSLLFTDAVAQQDLAMLRRLSTPEFAAHVWDRMDEAMANELLAGYRGLANARLVSVAFEGAVTRVTVVPTRNVGANSKVLPDTRLEVVLRDWDGELRVDDLVTARIDANGGAVSANNTLAAEATPVEAAIPSSFKRRMEGTIPILEFAAGVHLRDIRRIQRTSSDDFNRLVWKQTQVVPDIGFPIVQHLRSPVTSIKFEDDQATVVLGDQSWGAVAALNRLGNVWVIDDVQLIGGVQPHQRTNMKNTMRIGLALQFRQPEKTVRTDRGQVTIHADDVNARLPALPEANVSPIRQSSAIIERETQYTPGNLRPLSPLP